MSDEHDIPDPDAPATDAERAHATSLARLVDGMLDDVAPPPALNADERALLETATLVRASAGTEFALTEARRKALVDDALASAVRTKAGAHRGHDELAKRRLRRLAPWALTAVAAAAALVFALRTPPQNVETRATNVPTAQRSRPSDSLVGRIDQSDAHRASERMDAIYADRSSGFRAVRFSRVRTGGDQ